jgi:hypothetical protein
VHLEGIVIARIGDYKSNHGEDDNTNFADEKHDY